MKRIKHLLMLAICLINYKVFAEGSSSIEMADTMRSEGKIYVVVAVLVVIFIGFFTYLISTDRKVKKIETELEERKN